MYVSSSGLSELAEHGARRTRYKSQSLQSLWVQKGKGADHGQQLLSIHWDARTSYIHQVLDGLHGHVLQAAVVPSMDAS